MLNINKICSFCVCMCMCVRNLEVHIMEHYSSCFQTGFHKLSSGKGGGYRAWEGASGSLQLTAEHFRERKISSWIFPRRECVSLEARRADEPGAGAQKEMTESLSPRGQQGVNVFLAPKDFGLCSDPIASCPLQSTSLTFMFSPVKWG